MTKTQTMSLVPGTVLVCLFRDGRCGVLDEGAVHFVDGKLVAVGGRPSRWTAEDAALHKVASETGRFIMLPFSDGIGGFVRWGGIPGEPTCASGVVWACEVHGDLPLRARVRLADLAVPATEAQVQEVLSYELSSKTELACADGGIEYDYVQWGTRYAIEVSRLQKFFPPVGATVVHGMTGPVVICGGGGGSGGTGGGIGASGIGGSARCVLVDPDCCTDRPPPKRRPWWRRLLGRWA